jgi:hypothetical protein
VSKYLLSRHADHPRTLNTSDPARARLRRHGFRRWLAFALTLAVTPAAQVLTQQRKAAGGGVHSLSVVVTQIGDTAIRGITQAEPRPRARVAYYYAGRREIVSGRLLGSVPFALSLYPLVRREGAQKWEVQTVALNATARGDGWEWKAEVRFGDQTDDGGSFELRVVASREPLPAGVLSFDILSRNALSMSDVIRVRRRVEGTAVWIPYINNIAIYGNDLIDVKLQAPVEVRSRALPQEAQIGVAVQPTKPWTDRRWVMDGTVSDGEGVIYAYFGRLGLDAFDEFEVLAFVAWQDDFPPRGVGIPQAGWERLENKFIAKSRVVRVIRWEGEFKIAEIGGKKVIPHLILPADRQTDIYGSVSKPLNAGEKVWIICLPRGGEPWVAGWTEQMYPAGRWVVNAAQLWKEGQPNLTDVLAVIAADDPTKVSPTDLRSWIYQTRRPLHSVRVLVTNTSAR